MTSSDFAKGVEEACESALVDAGFKKLRKGRVVYEISSDFFGWVGLNKGVHGDMLRINPFVGVHAIAVMKLCAQLENVKYVKGEYATYAIHLGQILPDASTFEFRVGESYFEESRRLANCLAQRGLEYMISIADFDGLLPLIEARIPMLGGYPERYACMLYLCGKRVQARRFVSNVMNLEGDLARISNDSFATFADNFLKLPT